MILKNKILFSLFAICVLIACGTSSNWVSNEYVDNNMHLRIPYSKQWKFDSTDFVLRENLENADDAYQEKIVLGFEKMPMKIDAKTYAEGTNTQYKLLDTSLIISTSAAFLNNTMEGYKSILKSGNNLDQITACYVLVKDTFAYTIHCTSNFAGFDKHQLVFDSIIANIQFIK